MTVDGTEWLLSFAADRDHVREQWEEGELATFRVPADGAWEVVEAGLMPSLDAMRVLGGGKLGPVLAYPEGEVAYWLTSSNPSQPLEDLSHLTVLPAGAKIQFPSVSWSTNGRCWLQLPDGSGKLTDPIELGAVFSPVCRLPAEAFG